MYRAQAITFGRLHTWTLSFYYDKAADALTIRAPWRQEGVWVELPEQVRVYVDRQTGEGFAFEIGAFRSGFLAKRPDLAETWRQVDPSPMALRRMENTPFIRGFLTHVQQLAWERDRQLDPARLS